MIEGLLILVTTMIIGLVVLIVRLRRKIDRG